MLKREDADLDTNKLVFVLFFWLKSCELFDISMSNKNIIIMEMIEQQTESKRIFDEKQEFYLRRMKV